MKSLPRFGERYAGVTDGYSEVQVVDVGDGTRLQVRTIVVSFNTSLGASIWIKDAAERQGRLTAPDEVIIDDEFPNIGEESIALTHALDSGHGVRQASIRRGS